MSEADGLPHMTNIKALVETGPIASSQARRAGGRAGRVQLRQQAQAYQAGVMRKIPPYELLGPEAVARLHQASIAILEDVGIEFRDAKACEAWRRAGAKVEGSRVRMDGGLVAALIAKIPSSFTLHARNGQRSVEIGGEHSIFVPMQGAKSILKGDGTRPEALLADVHVFHKLSHLSADIHALSSGLCEPQDVAAAHRHLHMLHSAITHSDKPFTGLCATPAQAQDTLAMMRLVFGNTDKPCVLSTITCRSPLVWDANALQAMEILARAGQPCIISPSALAGATTSASTAGAVAQVNAEALAGLAYTQLIAPGSPQVYGQFIVAVDMRSGAPMGGTPEAAQMTLIFGQLARHYGLCWRTSAFHSGSKIADAQAGYESNMLMHAAMLSGAHVISQAAGWLDGGQTASLAKFMLDCDQLASWHKYAQGVSLDDLDGAMEAVRQVGPAGHFLGTAHTLANFERAFHTPALMDFGPVEQWEHEGSQSAAQRAEAQAGWTLERYELPELDAGVKAALADYIGRRGREIPA